MESISAPVVQCRSKSGAVVLKATEESAVPSALPGWSKCAVRRAPRVPRVNHGYLLYSESKVFFPKKKNRIENFP